VSEKKRNIEWRKKEKKVVNGSVKKVCPKGGVSNKIAEKQLESKRIVSLKLD